MTTSPVSIVIADDHPFVLLGVAGLLQAQSDMNVVATCNEVRPPSKPFGNTHRMSLCARHRDARPEWT